MHRLDGSRRRARAAWLAVLLVHGAWAAESSAPAPRLGRPPKVITLVVGEDAAAQEETGRLEALSQAALGRSGKFELIRIFDVLDPTPVKLREEKRQEAEAAMRQGEQAYNDLDTQAAQGHFERALKAYDQTDLTRTFEAFIHAWVMKLAAQTANGQGKAAEKELEKLLPLSPKVQFPPSFFGPDFIARAERLRKKIEAQPQVTMEVRTTPGGAEVFVDGESRGRAPVTVPRLVPGEHLVTAVAPGTGLWQQATRETVVDIALPPAELLPAYRQTLARLAADVKGKTRDATAAEFARTLGADQVLLAAAKKSLTGPKLEVTVVRLDASDTHNLGYRKGMVALGDTLPQQWDALLQPVLARDEPRANGKPVHKSDATFEWNKRATGLTLLGVGVVAIGASTFTGLKAFQEHDAYNHTPQTDTATSQAHRSAGQTFALVADVSALVGLATVATGGYLAFLAPEESAAPAPAPVPPPVVLPMPPPPGEAPPPRKGGGVDPEALRREEEARQKADAQRGQGLVKPEPGKPDVRGAEEARQKDEARRGQGLVKPEPGKAPEAHKPDDAKRKPESEEERRRREAEKKKKPDEDDLRNY